MKNFPRAKSPQQIIHHPLHTPKKYVYCLVANKAIGKFHNLKTLSHFISKHRVIGTFNYAEEKSYLKILIRRFWEKSGVGGGLVALQYLFA